MISLRSFILTTDRRNILQCYHHPIYHHLRATTTTTTTINNHYSKHHHRYHHTANYDNHLNNRLLHQQKYTQQQQRRRLHHHHNNHPLKQQNNTTKISFMTDVEGDASYFDRFISRSPILSHDNEGNIIFNDDENNENSSMFVFGGDIWDKGGHDLYVLEQLLSFRDRYPSRVHWVLGNRDINKMRLCEELREVGYGKTTTTTTMGDSDDDADCCYEHAGVWWINNKNNNNENNKNAISFRTRADALRWMLRDTMGSPTAFEMRRKELHHRRQREHDETITTTTTTTTTAAMDDIVNDEDVVRSYNESCHYDGIMGRYLRQGLLIYKWGEVAFVHGAMGRISLRDDGSLVMPWKNTHDDDRIDDHDTHAYTCQIDELNNFAKREVHDWGLSLSSSSRTSYTYPWASQGGYNQPHPGSRLMQYGMGWTPDRQKNATVVYSSWWDDHHHHDANDDKTTTTTTTTTTAQKAICNFMDREKLTLIVSGHRPHGDCPMPIRILPSGKQQHQQQQRSRWLVSCDTSYSGDVMWVNDNRMNQGRGMSQSGRGDIAVSEFIITLCSNKRKVLHASSHGILSDGTPYHSSNLWDVDKSSLVGTYVDEELLHIVDVIVVDDDSSSSSSGSSSSNHCKKEGLEVVVPHQNKKKWWVKLRLQDGRYLVSTSEGFNVWNAIAVLR